MGHLYFAGNETSVLWSGSYGQNGMYSMVGGSTRTISPRPNIK
jgi:hypothetical protein